MRRTSQYIRTGDKDAVCRHACEGHANLSDDVSRTTVGWIERPDRVHEFLHRNRRVVAPSLEQIKDIQRTRPWRPRTGGVLYHFVTIR